MFVLASTILVLAILSTAAKKGHYKLAPFGLRDLSCNVKDPFGTLAFIVYLKRTSSEVVVN